MARTPDALIRPELLVWARQSAGFGLDAAAAKLQVFAERLRTWESGEARPTIAQLRGGEGLPRDEAQRTPEARSRASRHGWRPRLTDGLLLRHERSERALVSLLPARCASRFTSMARWAPLGEQHRAFGDLGEHLGGGVHKLIPSGPPGLDRHRPAHERAHAKGPARSAPAKGPAPERSASPHDLDIRRDGADDPYPARMPAASDPHQRSPSALLSLHAHSSHARRHYSFGFVCRQEKRRY